MQIYNAITFPSFARRGGPATAFSTGPGFTSGPGWLFPWRVV